MATRAEQASSKEDMGPWDRFQAWVSTLNTPPVFTLADKDIVSALMMRTLLAKWREAAEAEQRGTVDEGDVPAGWDNDTLLAEMRASMRGGD